MNLPIFSIGTKIGANVSVFGLICNDNGCHLDVKLRFGGIYGTKLDQTLLRFFYVAFTFLCLGLPNVSTAETAVLALLRKSAVKMASSAWILTSDPPAKAKQD